jgi:hypothetical protein
LISRLAQHFPIDDHHGICPEDKVAGMLAAHGFGFFGGKPYRKIERRLVRLLGLIDICWVYDEVDSRIGQQLPATR